MAIQTFLDLPSLFRRRTYTPIYANQNNNTTPKNTYVVLCFVKLCIIVNTS